MEPKRDAPWRSLLDIVAMTMMIAASGAIVWVALFAPRSEAPTVAPTRSSVAIPVPQEPVSVDRAPILGAKNAPVVVIEYSDFECQFCTAFSREVLPFIVDKHIRPGRLQLAFRHLPIESRHPNAFSLAVAAECSRQQGKFWEMHDSLFSTPLTIAAANLIDRAEALGVDLGTFQACLENEASGQVRSDIEGAKRLGVSGTPTFLFGRLRGDGRVAAMRWYRGTPTQDVFDRLVSQVMRWPARE